MERYPFAYDPAQPFISQVSDWVADVFYDILPEAGFEVRDEQIYMAFQLERAFQEKQTIFAEAGVGTGKTLAYLLYAICYARYTRKPAIIACANESLIEQLVKPEGDIAKLAKHLDLTIDARLGKSPDQYICLRKLDEARYKLDSDEVFMHIYEELPSFVHKHEALQSFTPYGDRSAYSALNDQQWSQMNWDAFQDCFVCDRQHRCGQTLSRNHYRQSADLIICSHDFYMEHVWTYEARKRGGQLPLLPNHSSVIFDEGHLLEPAAQKALTYKLNHSVFEEIITRLLQGEIRESLAVAIEEAIIQSEDLFLRLNAESKPVAGSTRKEISFHPQLIASIHRFTSLIASIEEELALESGLYSLDEFQLRIVEEHLEMMQLALGLFQKPDHVISWMSEEWTGPTLVVMPKMVQEVLRERVFAQNMPIIFSSATLSVEGSFDYIADSLGIEDYLSFSVASPYEYAEQMEAFVPPLSCTQPFAEKMDLAVSLLQKTGGRALLLFSSMEEMQEFKAAVGAYPECASMRFWYEGDAEISHLISCFQNDEESILCAVTLWEGLDVPGPSLSNVIIWSLPFPPNDPVFAAKRKSAASPFAEVDLPYMLLRLRQGIGRLIRTREDSGIVSILSPELWNDEQLRKHVQSVFPAGVEWRDAWASELV
ncbi:MULTISPECIES: ATP-dependent DNA helicase [Brevibacillus]|uniref:ATP-dependent DNA helicase n=1 Tax=Brevibacillus TaxID=55080 RepID=UPI00156A955C|nr:MULTISPECIES: ATP-dependent DNA helicase [Brevibacillus]NRQ52455.1 ATP-dependent DNA helicase [Brevibacillus sp. HD1.4A]MDH6349429.1 ATP-dependent DNA helicase DinG [Brevibacillus sp. 1238]MDR5002541.1 ATP-dependent DNA helicase [Brevibacillus parabrevis]MED1724402.1 ATP-dependent DNA helicase [Brevibacillus parabrevis]MED2257301.1 ATP-dependent DNA helicase [Brevibacillus parabrevis]